jgi:predicted ATPase
MTNDRAGTQPLLRLRLENFRLFRDSGEFPIAPLTCLVGRNSSGKSSILSAILLLKQSIEQPAMGWGVTPLVLSGPYCDLGDYSDAVNNHRQTSQISFLISMDISQVSERGEDSSNLVDLAIPQPRVASQASYYFPHRESDLSATKGEISIHLTFSVDRPYGPSLSRVELKVGDIEARTVRTIRGERRQHWRTYTTGIPQRAIIFRTAGRGFFPLIRIRENSSPKLEASEKKNVTRFVSAATLFFRKLQRVFALSDVLGPFRTPPERRYVFGGFGASRRGTSGEQAVDLLISEAMLRSKGSRSLHAALGFWIKHLKLATSLSVRDIAKRLNLFELDLRGAGAQAKANLADVGFGVSQVLPVLVQGLLMRRGGIYLVQQPELHLHPDAQAGLADFFIYLASQGIYTVVETHSEHILLRVRRRLAEGANPIGPMGINAKGRTVRPIRTGDVAVLYTGSEGRDVVVRQLDIGESFQFENLPDGFMTQALDDRIALLRALEKKNG